MVCQDCEVEAPTKYVCFHQNIGALIVSYSTSVEGYLCKSCIHRHFWGMSTVTFFLGWWGMISLFVTPIFLLNNIGRYLFCLGMPRVPPGAERPRLTKAVVDQIEPYADELYSRVNAGEDFTETVNRTAALAGVTPCQVLMFIDAIAQAQALKK